MPASLVPSGDIAKLADQVDSPAMLRVLLRLREAGFILNGDAVDSETVDALKQLANLGLVDPGYAPGKEDAPFIWVSNANGQRLLNHLQETLSPRIRIDSRARAALQSLSDGDRQAVQAAVLALARRDPAGWPRELAIRLDEDQTVYLVRVSPDLRAFVRVVEAGGIQLFDLVRDETLQMFRQAGGRR